MLKIKALVLVQYATHDEEVDRKIEVESTVDIKHLYNKPLYEDE